MWLEESGSKGQQGGSKGARRQRGSKGSGKGGRFWRLTLLGLGVQNIIRKLNDRFFGEETIEKVCTGFLENYFGFKTPMRAAQEQCQCLE